MPLWAHSSAHFSEVLCHIFILCWSSRLFDLLPSQPILFRSFSLQSASFSHPNPLPASLPFPQLLPSHLLITVSMSNQFQLFFLSVAISFLWSYSPLSHSVLAPALQLSADSVSQSIFFFSHTLNFSLLFFFVKLLKGDQEHRKDRVLEPYFTFKELDEELQAKLCSVFCFQCTPVRLFSTDDACLVLLFSTRNWKKLKHAVQKELLHSS